MIFENARLLLRLLWRPADAMSAILDQGSLLFASAAVLVISLLLQFSLSPRLPQAPIPVQQTQAAKGDEDQPTLPAVPARPRWSFSFYTPLLVLAVVYVPGTLLVTSLIARLGGFGAVFQRDYSSLLTCTSFGPWLWMPMIRHGRPVLPAASVVLKPSPATPACREAGPR